MRIDIGRNRNGLNQEGFLYNHLTNRPELFKALYDVEYRIPQEAGTPDVQVTKEFYDVPSEVIQYRELGSHGETIFENYNEHTFFNNLFAVGKEQIDHIQYGYVVGTVSPMGSDKMMSATNKEYYSMWVNIYLKK